MSIRSSSRHSVSRVFTPTGCACAQEHAMAIGSHPSGLNLPPWWNPTLRVSMSKSRVLFGEFGAFNNLIGVVEDEGSNGSLSCLSTNSFSPLEGICSCWGTFSQLGSDVCLSCFIHPPIELG